MITTENITSHELIGLDTKIIESSNPQITGLRGKIVDETKSMIVLDTKKGTKLISKAHNTWEFSVVDGSATVNGSNIQKRPYDRMGIRP